MCGYVHNACRYLQKPEEAIKSSRSEVIGFSCEQRGMCLGWYLNLGPLEGQQTLLTAKPSLHPVGLILTAKSHCHIRQHGRVNGNP